MSKFSDWVMEASEGVSIREPLKKQIKKVYKQQPRLKKNIVAYKPKLSFEKKDA